jgi:endonuclease/exonuclease/phosphatase family metal-dependent hydrolase
MTTIRRGTKNGKIMTDIPGSLSRDKVWKNVAICFTILVCIFGQPSVGIGDDSKPTIRVLCYNIHYGQGNDGVYDIQRLADVIKQHKPDLVAVQEVDVGVERSSRIHEAQLLGELTGMSVRYGPTQHYQGGLFGNAILSRLPIVEVVIHPLPYTESTPERVTYPRGAIALTVRGPNEKLIRFVSTHFQHNVPEDRVAEAAAINQLFAGDDVPTILAGDMNAKPGSDPIRTLLEKWTSTVGDSPLPTAPSAKPTSRIDYIFYRPQAAFELIEARVVDEPMASDHCPVFAALKLR